jgi:uncharacterized protein YodC (DUF2158 family)
MDTQLKAGDVVQLKSGGPKMTIHSIGNAALTKTPTAVCDWFEDDKKTNKRASFSPDSLKL